MSPVSLTQLPMELLLNVFSNLDPYELAQTCRVCRLWNEIANDHTLWKRWGFSNEVVSNWKQRVIDQIRKERCIGIYPYNDKLYMARGADFSVLRNRNPTASTVLEYKPPLQPLRMTCCSPYPYNKMSVPPCEANLLTGSDDHLIRLWSIKEVQDGHFEIKCLNTLMGHQGAINHIKIRNEFIFSASNDQTVRIWKIDRRMDLDINDIRLVFSTKEIKGKINTLVPLTTDFNQYSFCIATENRIEKYSIDEKGITTTDVIYSSPNDKIITLQMYMLKQQILLSGSSSGNLCFWEMLNNGKFHLIQTIKAHVTGLTAIASHSFKRQIITGSSTGEVCLWEKKTQDGQWELKERFREQEREITQIRYTSYAGHAMQQAFFCLSKDNIICGWDFIEKLNRHALLIKCVNQSIFS